MFHFKLFLFYCACIAGFYYINFSPWIYYNLGVALLLSFIPRFKGYACVWVYGVTAVIFWLFIGTMPAQAINATLSVIPSTVEESPSTSLQTPNSCETPQEYLLCKVYRNEITWEQYDRMDKIISCESSWNPNAIGPINTNGTIDRGLVQINSVHEDISVEDMFNPYKSIDWMIQKANKDGGFRAWSCNKLID